MNYLLDTHVFLWTIGGADRLSPQAAKVIRDRKNAIFVSAVSAVEIAIKTALGKLEAPSDLEEEIAVRGYSHLPLRYAHGEAMRALPMHHQDPFDRMLLAQALHEGLTIISHDRKFESYPVELLET